MAQSSNPLERIQVRQHLEEVNHFLLHGLGEISEAPGKVSLVWSNPNFNEPRFLAVKAAGDDGILVNGRWYAASQEDLRRGIRQILKEMGV